MSNNSLILLLKSNIKVIIGNVFNLYEELKRKNLYINEYVVKISDFKVKEYQIFD